MSAVCLHVLTTHVQDYVLKRTRDALARKFNLLAAQAASRAWTQVVAPFICVSYSWRRNLLTHKSQRIVCY